MDGMKFLQSKFNLQDKQNVIDVINHYADNNRFFEAFSCLNHSIMFHDMTQVYYNTLSKYLSFRKPSTNCNDVILTTWTISPKNVPFLHMSDPEKRLRESMFGLAAWILDKTFQNIAIVESSNFKLNVEKLKQISKQYGKVVEYFTFRGSSEEVSRFGKGYGEGETIKVALNNNLLGSSDRFTKVTGKQYIPFYEYSFLSGNATYEFFNLHHIANRVSVDTRFYCIDKKFYCENVVDSYKEVDDHNGNYLESVFYEKIKNRLNYYIPKEPIVFGKQGSIDKNYGDYPQIVLEFGEYLIQQLV